MPRQLPEPILEAKKDWWRGYKVWIAIHWTLSAFATVGAALAPALPSHAQVFGIIAAASSSLIGLGNPYRRANGFSRAHRILGHACIEFETDETVLVQALLQAHKEGDQIIEAAES